MKLFIIQHVFELIMGNGLTLNFYERIATSIQEVIGGKAAVVYPSAKHLKTILTSVCFILIPKFPLTKWYLPEDVKSSACYFLKKIAILQILQVFQSSWLVLMNLLHCLAAALYKLHPTCTDKYAPTNSEINTRGCAPSTLQKRKAYTKQGKGEK